MSPIEKFIVNSERRQRSRIAQAERLLAKISMADAHEYLEVGCGAGAVARRVASQFAVSVTGVDIDPGQIDLAISRAGGLRNARFLEADAANLPFEDQTFDVVLTFMATHHIAHVSEALQEIRRVLKPGGYLVYADIFLPRFIAALGSLVGHSYHLPRSDAMRSDMEHHGFRQIFASRDKPRFHGEFEGVYVLATREAQ